ncbi:MAG TPA: Crp/Fnr family transcriptional regulator [Alphaproteobacteria bacterium]|nr:Crp/Fnr family transcriptional regulator [Alphaproteobacteria bacterium]
MLGVSLAEKRKLLRQSLLLSRLGDSEADALLAYARLQRYAAGAAIFAKGDAGASMMAVTKGRVRISAPSLEGKEVVLNIIGPGEVFGEIALLDGKERTADATAMTACELLVLERRHFLPVLERHPELCLHLLQVLCERLRRTSEQVEDVLFRHLQSRLAKALLRLAADHGAGASAGGRRIDLKLSQRELGNLVGGTRESINKQLQAWQRAGIIALDKGAIVIRDGDALEAMS